MYILYYVCEVETHSIFPNVGEYMFDPKAQPTVPGTTPGVPAASSYFGKPALEDDVRFTFYFCITIYVCEL